jgi:hypothetical protein
MTTKKTPTKQNKRETKATDKAKAKKEAPKKSVSKGKIYLCPGFDRVMPCNRLYGDHI